MTKRIALSLAASALAAAAVVGTSGPASAAPDQATGISHVSALQDDAKLLAPLPGAITLGHTWD